MNDLESVFRAAVEGEIPANAYHREFARSRYAEGAKALAYLTKRYPEHFHTHARILDLGGGNGGFLLPFVEQGFDCLWSDCTFSRTLDAVLRSGGPPLRRVLCDAARLPLAASTIDVVLYVETIEHVDARAVGREIARVLRRSGLCYITTPPRLRFLGRDPHYGVRGLLMLPDGLQKRMFEHIRPHDSYDVEHVFWSTAGIMRTLPGLELREITSSHFAGPLRRLDWDWLVAVKS